LNRRVQLPEPFVEQFEAEGPEPAPVEPERVIAEPTPKAWQPAPATPKPMGISEVPMRAPRNELEADLFEKLRVAREKAQQQ